MFDFAADRRALTGSRFQQHLAFEARRRRVDFIQTGGDPLDVVNDPSAPLLDEGDPAETESDVSAQPAEPEGEGHDDRRVHPHAEPRHAFQGRVDQPARTAFQRPYQHPMFSFRY